MSERASAAALPEGVTIRETAKPSAEGPADEPAMRDLAAQIELWNAMWRARLGGDDLSETPEQARITWTRPSDWTIRRWVAERDGEIVGSASAFLDDRDATDEANVQVIVREDARRAGIGSALAARMIEELEAAGRTRLEAWVLHDADGEEWISPSNGVGRIPADDAAARLCRKLGMELGQVERMSVLELDASPATRARLERMRDDAQTAAGEDYRLLAWTAPSPDERLDDLARLAARMSTDEPAGDLERTQQTFDPERVRRGEDRSLESGRDLRYTVVEHVPSGRIVAQNVLAIIRAHPEWLARQEDTLVLPEHRGHRLGMLVKAAGLLGLLDEVPDARGVITWNAEENRHMLDVNEAVGFRPIGAEGAWQRRSAG